MTAETAPSEGRALAAARRAFGAGWRPTRRAVAPGRIELIGNHLDYNGGPVLAAAIDRRVVVLAGPVPDGDGDAVWSVADDVGGEARRFSARETAGWWHGRPPERPEDYVRGLVAAAADGGVPLRLPAAVSFAGDVPIGLGLSSSAAICVGLALALAAEALGDQRTVLLAQAAEHRAGTPCGTMDQSASVAGGVILFDGATLGVERLSPELGDHVFAVVDSGVDRSLGASAYPVRVEESRRALELANATLGLRLEHLAFLTADQMAALEGEAPPGLDDALRRRIRHVTSETERVRGGAEALRAADWARFGALMTASGRSSAQDYDISHPRVEELVAEILTVPGVLGARMMGGGGGGAVLALLPAPAVAGLRTALTAGYGARHGLNDRPSFVHICAFAEGAHAEDVTERGD